MYEQCASISEFLASAWFLMFKSTPFLHKYLTVRVWCVLVLSVSFSPILFRPTLGHDIAKQRALNHAAYNYNHESKKKNIVVFYTMYVYVYTGIRTYIPCRLIQQRCISTRSAKINVSGQIWGRNLLPHICPSVNMYLAVWCTRFDSTALAAALYRWQFI